MAYFFMANILHSFSVSSFESKVFSGCDHWKNFEKYLWLGFCDWNSHIFILNHLFLWRFSRAWHFIQKVYFQGHESARSRDQIPVKVPIK